MQYFEGTNRNFLGNEAIISSFTRFVGFFFKIESGPRKLFIDGKNENISNWLRYVNCARNSFEENTNTFNCGSKKFYYTIKDVHPSSELLVWYGMSYGKWLDIEKINPGEAPNQNINLVFFNGKENNQNNSCNFFFYSRKRFSKWIFKRTDRKYILHTR